MGQQSELANVLQTAKALCGKHGTKLTNKRLSVLEVLLLAEESLSAYELADRVSQHTQQATKPMSIYRILEFLEDQDLAHRLNMTNRYIACNKILCCQEHGLSQFLICKQCERVQEVSMSNEMYQNFMQQISNASCDFKSSHIELEVICGKCKANAQSVSNSNDKELFTEENDYASSTC